MRSYFTCQALSLFLLLAGSAVAGTVDIAYTEPLKRTWTHEVLGFRVEVPRGEWRLDELFVTDASGAIVPSQIGAVLDQHTNARSFRSRCGW